MKATLKRPNQTKSNKPNLPNQAFHTKSTKSNLPNQNYQTEPNVPNETYQSKKNLPWAWHSSALACFDSSLTSSF